MGGKLPSPAEVFFDTHNKSVEGGKGRTLTSKKSNKVFVSISFLNFLNNKLIFIKDCKFDIIDSNVVIAGNLSKLAK